VSCIVATYDAPPNPLPNPELKPPKSLLNPPPKPPKPLSPNSPPLEPIEEEQVQPHDYTAVLRPLTPLPVTTSEKRAQRMTLT